jgi:hypothetical protein
MWQASTVAVSLAPAVIIAHMQDSIAKTVVGREERDKSKEQ